MERGPDRSGPQASPRRMDRSLREVHPPEHLRGDGGAQVRARPWSPTGSDDYVRTYRALVSSLAYKFRAMLAEGNVVAATDEEEAFDEARLYAARLGNLEPGVLQEATDRMWKTAKVFYAVWSMDPEVKTGVRLEIPAVAQLVEDKADEDTARFIIVLSKKGAMLRLHRSDGCSKA